MVAQAYPEKFEVERAATSSASSYGSYGTRVDGQLDGLHGQSTMYPSPMYDPFYSSYYYYSPFAYPYYWGPSYVYRYGSPFYPNYSYYNYYGSAEAGTTTAAVHRLRATTSRCRDRRTRAAATE